MRTNGFQSPLNGMQMATWVLLPLLIAQYLMCVTPVLPKVQSIPLTAVYVIAGIAATYHGYITTKTDSVDFLLHQHLYGSPSPHDPQNQNRQNGSNNDDQIVNDQETPATAAGETKYCWVCQTNVHQESMHCKYCDKCVATFDHHCMWLNTCVGAANYPSFFKTVVWTLFFVLVHVASLTLYIGLYFTNDLTVRRLSRKWFSLQQPIVLVGLNIGFLVWTASIAFMVMQLFIFHVGLRRESITTYQYIMRDTQRKREKSLLANRVRQRRVEELNNAGNSMESMLLKMGGLACCKPCDPVRKLVLQEAEQAEVNDDNESRNSESVKDSYSFDSSSDRDETAPHGKTSTTNRQGSHQSLGNGDIGGGGSRAMSPSSMGNDSSTMNSDGQMSGAGKMGSMNFTYCSVGKEDNHDDVVDDGQDQDSDSSADESESESEPEEYKHKTNKQPIFIKVKNGEPSYSALKNKGDVDSVSGSGSSSDNDSQRQGNNEKSKKPIFIKVDDRSSSSSSSSSSSDDTEEEDGSTEPRKRRNEEDVTQASSDSCAGVEEEDPLVLVEGKSAPISAQ